MNVAGGRPGQKHEVNVGWTSGGMACYFLDIRLFDCLFLSDSRGCWVRRRHKISILFLYLCVHYRGKPGNEATCSHSDLFSTNDVIV